ncbi:MAG: metallophosphoesterase family protein [Opitutaceae bacterium]|nr:metallophosphoesterase family protein [Opitutaceae bacterium]
MDEPIRILSDLHLGHSASLARDISQIGPLFRGVGTVVFNGDTVEMRSERDRELADQRIHAVHEFCAEQAAASYFINGNHDPIISTINHMEIDEGRILVTHGDVLFHETSPHRPRRFRGSMHARRLDGLTPEELAHFEQILSTNKRVTAFHDDYSFSIPEGQWGKFATFMKQTWPPRRLVNMVSSWTHTHVNAINLVRAYRPHARVIVVGHTHFPGIWHRHGYTVVNTGSYLPMLGRLAVDFEGGHVTVRKVVFRSGEFHLGRVLSRIPLRRRGGQLAA